MNKNNILLDISGLNARKEETLKVTYTPSTSDIKKKITWTSSDPNVAIISPSGTFNETATIKSKASGRTTIIAKTFANMCIERQLITAVKNSNRQKHIPLNSSISLNSAAYEDNDDMDKLEIVDLKAEDDPSDIIVNQEYSKTIERKIKENLSEYELSVLYEYEKGHSYADIAEKLKTKVKSVDTAIQRIKKKANKIKESIDS